MLFAICPLRESDTQPAAEPPPPYGHALMGVRVLKFDGAIAPRVLKFDSGPAAEGCGGRVTFIEGASLYKTFTIGLLPVGKPYNRHAGEEMQSPFGGWRHHLARWEACHWIRGSRGSPMNPVPLPPPQLGGATKGKRLNGQAGRLTSPHLEVRCRTSTGDYKAPLCCELLMKGLLFRALFCPLHRGKSGEAG